MIFLSIKILEQFTYLVYLSRDINPKDEHYKRRDSLLLASINT